MLKRILTNNPGFIPISYTSLATIIICLLVVYMTVLINQRKNAHHVKLAKLFPGPKTIPFLGNSLELIKSGQVGSQKLLQYIQEYGSKPFRLWIGSELFIVLSDAEDIEAASNIAISKPEILRPLKDIHGNSLFTCLHANEVKFRRKRFNPVFNTDSILDHLAVIEKKAAFVLETLSIYSKTKQPYNIWNLIPFITFDITTKTMMDVEVNPDEKIAIKYHVLNTESLNFTMMRSLAMLPKMLDMLIFRKTVNRYNQKYIKFIKKVWGQNVNEMKEISNQENESLSALLRKDNIRSQYFQAAHGISLDLKDPLILYYEMIAIIGAGTHTTAASICYTVLMLSIHQDIQDKVYNELYEIFGDSNREASPDDLKKMTYMEQVIKESLRHNPVVTYIFRHTERDIKLRDYILPADTNIMMFLFGTHYNPQYYPEPHKFNPDNFSQQAIASRPKCTFLSFYTGPRDCIGKRFAMVEMKIILSAMLRRYKFNTNIKMEDIKYSRSFLTTIADHFYNFLIEDRK